MSQLRNDKLAFKKILLRYFSLASMGALGGLIYLLVIPSDSKNSFLFGYSAPRLTFITFFLIAAISAAVFALKSWRGPRWAQRIDCLFFTSQKISNWALGISGAVFLVFGLLSLVPIYRFEQFAAYAERLRPFVFYIVQISFQTLILILQRNGRLHWKSLAQEIRTHSLALWIGAGCMAIFGALWGIVARTGIGIQPTASTNWYETGVPVLAIQVVMAALIASVVTGLIAWIAHKWGERPPQSWGERGAAIDILLSITIWALATFLWAQAPMSPNFFAPGPFLPDNAYLPYSDAASFDLYAQYALVGKGIANGNVFVGHNGYHGFLAFLHLLAGQDYALLVTWQVAIFAVLAVIVYFIGKAMHSRFLGIFLAGLTIVQELNAIASGSRLNLSHSKLLLTEFPTKICLAALILLLFLWLRKPEGNWAYALPLGGLLGIAILLRYNTFVILFGTITGLILVFGRAWRQWVKASVILIIALGFTISPWMWRSWKLSGNPFFFAPKILWTLRSTNSEAVLPSVDNPIHAGELRTPVSNLFAGSVVESEPLLPVVTAEFESISPSQINETESTSRPNPPEIDARQPQSEQTNAVINRKGTTYLIVSHFVHNLITSILVLPTRPIFDFLPASITDGSIYESVPFWKNRCSGWLENLPLVDIIGLACNLLIVSLGIGNSYRKWKWAGLIPLGVFLAYHLSTALVRDSGGRYIIPVDWIVGLYFGIGLLQIARWGSTWLGFTFQGAQSTTEQTFSIQAGILLTLPFFLFVLAMTGLDQAMPQRYPHLESTAILDLLIQEDLLDQTDIDAQSLGKFLDHPDARIAYGMNLYPRFFWQNQGLHEGIYHDRSYPRLSLTMITARGSKQVTLPLMEPPLVFPHGSDVIVIGCRKRTDRFAYIDALLIANLGTPPTIYTRAHAVPLACPLP
ncbi:MAG: hypothetical protein U9Q82_11215 [Chloroflexota bacterium]|nr:hypothetical protein [Chloroflexota bacterium]